MKHFFSPYLLDKYVKGVCTKEEVAMIHQWYDSFDNDKDYFVKMSVVEQEALRMLMLKRFKESLTSEPFDINAVSPGNSTLKRGYRIFGIAAISLICLGSFFHYIAQLGQSKNIATTVSEHIILNNQSTGIYKQILSDGSIVWLSPKSVLEYPHNFTGDYRQVKLRGEAFFEVTKDHTHPFIIHSGNVITRVWGTSFRIKAFENIPTEVSVISGRVSVRSNANQQKEVMLYPRQKAVYALSDKTLKKLPENTESDLRMWDKIFTSFENTPVDSVLACLGRQYHMNIRTEDKELGKYLFKADFTDQSLPAILEMLQNSLNAGYVIDDTNIVLYRKPQPKY